MGSGILPENIVGEHNPPCHSPLKYIYIYIYIRLLAYISEKVKLKKKCFQNFIVFLTFLYFCIMFFFNSN